jgi:WD40 repeat protein
VKWYEKDKGFGFLTSDDGGSLRQWGPISGLEVRDLTGHTGAVYSVAVSSDGVRLFVTDLGYNRVLIWNSIPTQNNQPADVVVGQPDFTSLSPSAFTFNAVAGGAAPTV